MRRILKWLGIIGTVLIICLASISYLLADTNWTLPGGIPIGTVGQILAIPLNLQPAFVSPGGDIASQLRQVTDGVVVSGSSTFTSASAAFTVNDVGQVISAPGNIPNSTTITDVQSSTTVVMSANGLVNNTGVTTVIGTTAGVWFVTGLSALHNIVADVVGGPWSVINFNINGILNPKAYHASGSNLQTTGGISSGSKVLTLASAGDFVNGEGIGIVGVGASQSLSTPSAPTFGTIGCQPPSTCNYTWTVTTFAINKDGSYTVQSPVLTTNIGPKNTEISGGAGNYLPINISPVAGQWAQGVCVSYNGGPYIFVGATTASTFNYWGWRPQGPGNSPSIEASPVLPKNGDVCPSSAQNGVLETTIDAGGGTTSIITHTAASQTIASGAKVFHSDTVAIAATETAARSTGAHIVFPPGQYVDSGTTFGDHEHWDGPCLRGEINGLNGRCAEIINFMPSDTFVALQTGNDSVGSSFTGLAFQKVAAPGININWGGASSDWTIDGISAQGGDFAVTMTGDENCSGTLATVGNRTIVDNSEFDSQVQAGVCWNVAGGFQNAVRHTHFSNGEANWMIIRGTNPDGQDVSDNRVENMDAPAFGVATYSFDDEAEVTTGTFDRNFLFNNAPGFHAVAGIFLGSWKSITGNTQTGMSNGFWFGGTGTAPWVSKAMYHSHVGPNTLGAGTNFYMYRIGDDGAGNPTALDVTVDCPTKGATGQNNAGVISSVPANSLNNICGSNGYQHPVIYVTTTYSIPTFPNSGNDSNQFSQQDAYIIADASSAGFTITLPPLFSSTTTNVSDGIKIHIFAVASAGGNMITIAPNGAGGAIGSLPGNLVLPTSNEWVVLESMHGAVWRVIGGNVFTTPPVNLPHQITYSASMTPDLTLGAFQWFTATDGSAMTINNPTGNGTGVMFFLEIYNNSGGALGTVTWGSGYIHDGITLPANTKCRVYTWNQNGANILLASQSPADLTTCP